MCTVVAVCICGPAMVFGQDYQQDNRQGDYQQQGMQRQRQSPEVRAGKQTEWMRKNLNINDDQARRVNNIIVKYAQRMDELMNMPRGQMKKEDRMDAMDRRDHDLSEVLSAEQFKLFKQHEEEMKARRKDHMGGGMYN